MFNFIAVRVLDEIQRLALEAGLVVKLPAVSDHVEWHDGEHPIDIIDGTYVDDTVFFFQPDKPQNVVNAARAIARIVVTVFTRRGLRINTKADKSEYMLRLVGRGSRQCLLDLTLDDTSVLAVVVDGVEYRIRVVAEYVHMGATLNTNSNMQAEATKRTLSMYNHFPRLVSEPIQIHVSTELSDCRSPTAFVSHVCFTWSRSGV